MKQHFPSKYSKIYKLLFSLFFGFLNCPVTFSLFSMFPSALSYLYFTLPNRFSMRMFHNYAQSHPCSFFITMCWTVTATVSLNFYFHIHQQQSRWHGFIPCHNILAISFIVKFTFPYMYLSTLQDQLTFIQIISFQPMNHLYIHFSSYAMAVNRWTHLL